MTHFVQRRCAVWLVNSLVTPLASCFIFWGQSVSAKPVRNVLFITSESERGQVSVEEALTESLLAQKDVDVHIRRVSLDGFFIKRIADAMRYDFEKAISEGGVSMDGGRGTRVSALTEPWLNFFEKSFLQIFAEEPIDGIITSFNVAPYYLSWLRDKGHIPKTTKIVAVLADLAVSSLYRFADVVIAPDDEVASAAEVLVGGRGGRTKIHTVAGILARRRFSGPYNSTAVKAEIGLASDRPLVLVLGGSGGHRLESLVAYLSRWQPSRPISVVFLVGRNANLEAELSALARDGVGSSLDLRIIPFTNDIDKYEKAADVVITKPGGATVGELAAIGKGMFSLGFLPGGEAINFRRLEEVGALLSLSSKPTSSKLFRYAWRDPAEIAWRSAISSGACPRMRAKKKAK